MTPKERRGPLPWGSCVARLPAVAHGRATVSRAAGVPYLAVAHARRARWSADGRFETTAVTEENARERPAAAGSGRARQA